MRSLQSGVTLTAALAAAPSRIEHSAAIVTLEIQRCAAIRARNIEFLAFLYADDYRGVTASGHTIGKVAIMAAVAHEPRQSRFLHDGFHARVFGDAAFLTGRMTERDGAGNTAGQWRYIHAFVRREGRWAIVSGEATAIPRDLWSEAPSAEDASRWDGPSSPFEDSLSRSPS